MSTLPTNSSPARRQRLYNLKARLISWGMIIFCTCVAALAVFCLFAIFGYIFYRGAEYLNWNFFFHSQASRRHPSAPSGAANSIVGTLIMVGLASIFGVPVGILCGIYLAEYSRDAWFSHLVRLVVDVLAGAPSILVGVLAYEIFVRRINLYHGFALRLMRAVKMVAPFVAKGDPSGWAGAMALAFIMCPIIARTTEEIIKLVPAHLREASLGLGASRTQTLFRVILPTARAGIITGIMLAIARIAGETAPLLFTAGGNNYLSTDPNKPMSALPFEVYKAYQSPPRPSWQHQTWACMLVLIVLILIFNLLVRFVSRNKMKVR